MLQFLAHWAKPIRVRVAPALLTIATLAVLAGTSPRMAASSLFFSGNLRTDATSTDCQGTPCTLTTDGDYAQYAAVVYSFNVASASTMTAITYSYGGGTSMTGALVAAGGLEPYLSLFNADGSFRTSAYLATTCPDGAKTYDGNCYDVALNGGTLNAGTYYIALSAYANMSYAENYGAGNLSDGFTGAGSLALDEDLHYAFDVILTPDSPPPPPPPPPPVVPEPNFTILMGTAFAGLFFLREMKLRAETQA
jgi:hypothetical protein